MSRKKSTPTMSFRRQIFLETLESRAMLAGNVNVFVSGGSLFVRGDGSDNAVIIQQQGNGIYSVTGVNFADLEIPEGFDGGPTKINGVDAGEGVSFSGVTNDINVDLGDGDDGLGIGNNLAGLDALARDCFGIGFLPTDDGGTADGGGDQELNAQAVAESLVVPRNLIVNLGNGNDFTAIDANVGALNTNGTLKKGGVANINAGNGSNGVAFGGTSEGHNLVADDLLISGGNGSDNVCVDNVAVRDLLSVQLGNGDGETTQHVQVFNVGAGHISINTNRGSDSINFFQVGVDREVTITTGAGNDSVFLSQFSAGAGDGPSGKNNNSGVVTIVTGDGDDQVGIGGFFGVFAADSELDQVGAFSVDNLTIDTGSGNDGAVRIDAPVDTAQIIQGGVFISNGLVTRVLTLVTGSGDDHATISNVTAHDIVVDTGSGDDGKSFPISIYNVAVHGNLTLVTGSGNDAAYIYSGGNSQQSNINGTVTVDLGSGDDEFEIVDQTIGKDLNVVLGSGNNIAGIGGGLGEAPGIAEGFLDVKRNVNITGGPQTDAVGLFNLHVHNNFFADLGAGDDFLLSGGEGTTVQIDKNATFIGGSGKDNMTLNFTNVGGNALIDAGSNDDTVSINFSHVAKTATILMGSGNDTLNIFNSTAKKLVARGGSGQDTFNNDQGIKNGRTSTTDVAEFELVPAV